MNLKGWEKAGWLVEHRTSRQEIADLLALTERDLKDCQSEGISLDWQFAIAYNAAPQCAKAALLASGYRPSRGENQHYRVIQSLALTLGSPREIVLPLEAFRKKRNISDYDVSGAVSAVEADEMKALAESLRRTLIPWLDANHPELR